MSDPGHDAGLMREAMAEIDRLLDKSRAERAVLLNTLAHSQPQLHALVLDLLEQEDPVNRGFMEVSAGAGAQGLREGSRLGPYRIIRLLGEGGMGEVWLASRDDGLYEGQVAIKTLHPYFAGGALRERFLREARVLGKLAHSNIARMLDAGIQDGVVYLVLEYVVGQPIDFACDERKLDIAARLGIFLRLCAAVAHAHSSLVIHRDIKPGNVLLTADGVTKLLDFGIANFYAPGEDAPSSDITRLTGRIFTPEYAAPEQVLGQEITTAADVYSLGVLLYVLLAGQLPYKPSESGRTQWEQAVLHQEPLRLVRTLDFADHEAIAGKRSTPFAKLRRELEGDLENIVQKALKKRPEERYSSVEAFADDIKRYLQGEPVQARADSAWYRLGKFAQRNRVAVGAAAAVVVALGIGLAVSLWQLQVAREERRHAEEVKDFMASIFRSANPFSGGTEEMTAAQLLALARERIDRELVSQPETAVEMLLLVGETQTNLDQRDAAKAALMKAIELGERLQPRDEVMLALARGRLATVLGLKGERAEALKLAGQVLPELRKHQPATTPVLGELLSVMAYIESEDGTKDRSIELAREALDTVSAILGPSGPETLTARYHLGILLLKARRFDEARPVAEQVLRDTRAQHPGERGALLLQAQELYGRALVEAREYQAAIPVLNEAIELSFDINGRPKNDWTWENLSFLGRAQQHLGDYKAYVATRQRAYDSVQRDHNRARMLANLARATFQARQVPEALELFPEAIELTRLHDTGKRSWLSLVQADYGAALALSGRLDEADRLLQATLPLARNSPVKSSLPAALIAIGFTRQLRAQWAESEIAFREALENTDDDIASANLRCDALQGIGIARLELGQPADAENWLRQAAESQSRYFLGMTPLRAEIAMNLGRALLAQGKIVQANESFAAANSYWLGYDASNPLAGQAAYWKARGHLAAGARQDAGAELARAIGLLKGSALPGDIRLVRDARLLVAKR